MISDTGFLHEKGSFGNLPAGEAFIAPVEGRSEGKLVFDGSFAGVDVLENPIELAVEEGGLSGAGMKPWLGCSGSIKTRTTSPK